MDRKSQATAPTELEPDSRTSGSSCRFVSSTLPRQTRLPATPLSPRTARIPPTFPQSDSGDRDRISEDGTGGIDFLTRVTYSSCCHHVATPRIGGFPKAGTGCGDCFHGRSLRLWFTLWGVRGSHDFGRHPSALLSGPCPPCQSSPRRSTAKVSRILKICMRAISTETLPSPPIGSSISGPP